MPQDARTTEQPGADGRSPQGHIQGDHAAAKAYYEQGNAAAQSGDFEAAEEAFARAITADPNDARARYNLALARQNLGLAPDHQQPFEPVTAQPDC